MGPPSVQSHTVKDVRLKFKDDKSAVPSIIMKCLMCCQKEGLKSTEYDLFRFLTNFM